MITKICKKCGKELPISEFGNNPMSKDKHINVCKRCRTGFPKEEILHCPVCNKDLPYYAFKAGGRTGRIWVCENCEKAIGGHSRTIRIKADPKFREYINKLKSDNLKKNFAAGMWRAAKRRAHIKGLDFNIEISDIVIPEICPILEVPLALGTKNNYEYTPSLDRIDNSKGYIKGNIMVVSKKANSMKNSATPTELQTFCTNILRYSPSSAERQCTEC